MPITTVKYGKDCYEELWEDWKELEGKLRFIKGIIQNPIKIPTDLLEEWKDKIKEFKKEFSKTVKSTYLAVLEENERRK